MTATPEHPFYVPGQGMTALGKLGIGTLVVTRAGPSVVVHSLVRQHSAAGILVYNLEVEGDHTYFVGTANGGEWVHNVCNVTWPGTMTEKEALEEGLNWVKSGYKQALGRTGQGSSGVYRSADGLRQFRMTTSDLLGSHGNVGPHVHFQTYDSFGNELENIHVPIVP